MSHKNIILLILFIFLVNCSTQKVTRIHGNLSLKNNENFILVNKSNKNDVIKVLGEPSTKSNFDNNVWFYIEQKKQNKSIVKLGKQYIEENNDLTIYFDNNLYISCPFLNSTTLFYKRGRTYWCRQSEFVYQSCPCLFCISRNNYFK